MSLVLFHISFSCNLQQAVLGYGLENLIATSITSSSSTHTHPSARIFIGWVDKVVSNNLDRNSIKTVDSIESRSR